MSDDPLFFLLNSLANLFGVGGGSLLSRLLGEQRDADARRVGAFSIYGSLFIAAIYSLVCLLFTEPLARLLGASDHTVGYASSYLRWVVVVGGIPSTLGLTLSHLLRSAGYSKESGTGLAIGGICNILLDPLFILVLGWGVKGAAFATVLSNGVNCIYLILLIRKRPDYFSMDLRNIRWIWEDTGGALVLGIPMMVSTLLSSFSGVLTNGFLAGYGDLFLAANGVSSKLRMVITMLIMGVCMGIQPGISYYYGAKQREKLNRLLRVTGTVSVIIGSVLAVVFLIFRDALVAAFIDDPEVIIYGSQMVLGCVISGPVQGIYQLSTNYLQGTGSVSSATVLAVLRQALHIPIMIVANYLFGFLGLVYSAAVATFLCTFVGLILCHQKNKKIWATA